MRSILNKAFFIKLYVDGDKVIDHEPQEPFGALRQAYRVYHLGSTRLPASRCRQAPGTGDSGTQGSSTDSLNLTSAGQVWSKASMVELRGIELQRHHHQHHEIGESQQDRPDHRVTVHGR
ncbi:MAG: hypothetical protein LC799_24415 [Actinobacteria bacterium]|nr:hypothetical protein [Actinomycetota bacterium]